MLRQSPEDFQVDEVLGYAADGAGEHCLLQLRKRNTNTEWLAVELARFAGVSRREVSYAGLKDRDAVTTQHFSVQLAGKPDPDWSQFPYPEVQILGSARHSRKLRRGALQANRFVLALRQIEGDRQAAELRLQAIASQGVPNYFGDQRFGRDGGNIAQARAMFAGRRMRRAQRSILLSAARSEIFNAVLHQRVTDGNWNTALDGELWCLSGSRSWFGPEDFNDDLKARLHAFDIHPSGPMWGRGALPSQAECAALEQELAAGYPEFTAGLADAGLDQERRALRLRPADFQWHWLDDDCLQVRFELPPGAYATSVMRELLAGAQID